jgi:shikimate dehydrogenase
MKLFAVTGKPIYFSRSPEIFKTFLDAKNIDAKYFRLAADSAKEAVSLFKELGLSGMNVTAPFKTEIIPFLDEINDLAKQIGAVNTVVLQDGKLLGYNTDYHGIINTLPNVERKKILILGAGGAAKALAFTLKKSNANVKIINRTTEKAKQLADEFNISFTDIKNIENEVKTAEIIINTLPSGIKIIEDVWLSNKQIFFDAIYHNSAYHNIAKEKGMQFYSGKSWLVNQAIESYKLFFNDEIEIDDSCFAETIKPKEKLIFIGFMGSGKSTIGKEIAEKLSCKYFSTDDILEMKEAKSINDIFAEHGEKYFRQTEEEILSMLASMSGKGIVSTGGGVVLSKNNRKILSENFYAIWLYANTDAIMARTEPKNRPLLKNNFTKERIDELMQERFLFYAQSSDLIIDTGNKTIDEIIDKLVNTELK